MARPKPHIILDYTEPDTYRAEQVLKADAIYTVFYSGAPINIRTVNKLVEDHGPKYKKTCFSSKGPAINLATKLNKLFNTNKFVPYRLTKGEKYSNRFNRFLPQNEDED